MVRLTGHTMTMSLERLIGTLSDVCQMRRTGDAIDLHNDNAFCANVTMNALIVIYLFTRSSGHIHIC